MIRDKGDAFVQEMKSGRNLNVMTFNIWRGSTSIDQVAEAIRTAEADVIGIQEADGQLPALARKLNYYYDEGHSILSRYPLHQSAHKEFIWIEVEPDEVAAMGNVHLCH
ncbi:endonuclease/exonuclease/phosphatase family protein, partial [Paenibacillus sp. E194]